MRINFVMSSKVESKIFNAIINYFNKYLPKDKELYVSQYPLKNMDIYHYHRPNLEKELLSNSVVTVHHDLEDNDVWFHVERYIDRYKEANLVICLNHTQKEILKTKYGITNTIIIPHGVDKNIFSFKKRIYDKKNKFSIGIVSKRYARRVKGEAYLYEVSKRLNPSLIKFILVGEGRTEDKIKLDNLGFEVKVYEELPYNLFNSLYHSINVLLVASLFEGGPANIPEAIYTGTPILGRKIAMIKDMLIEGGNGYFLTGDYNEDSQLINDLVNDTNNFYTNLYKNRYKNILDWEEIVDRHLEAYMRIIR